MEPEQSKTIPAAPPSSLPPTVATIDLSALSFNLDQAKRKIAPGCQILAVVKADAYGHGAVPIARALLGFGVSRFGVATLAEGILLREAGVAGQILVMGGLFPGETAEAVGYALTPVVYDPEQTFRLGEWLRARQEPCPVHLKVDTGMRRLGVSPEQVLPILESAEFQRVFALEGLMTHLADADNLDPTFTQGQLHRFRSLVDQVKSAGWQVPLVHAANSAAILRHPSSHFNLVRPGIMLYGYHTLARHSDGEDLKPVLRLTTRVVHVRSLKEGEGVSYNRKFIARRPSRIAVLPIGYADGYNRLLSDTGSVLIDGHHAPVVGQVCMDMTMVDVTDIPQVRPGHEVVLIGTQGDERITADDLATQLGTIPYEVLCKIGPRVPRVYTSGANSPHD